MKTFLVLAVLASGFALAPQVASAHDGRSGNYGHSNVGSYGMNQSRSYGQSYYAPVRVPNYGFNNSHGQCNSYGGYSNGSMLNGYNRSGYSQGYATGRSSGYQSGHGCSAW